MFAQYRAVILVVAAILLFSSGMGSAYKYQASKVKTAIAERDSVMQANKTEHETIKSLEKSLAAEQGICADRLRVKDRLLKGMMEIRSLSPRKTEVSTNETNTQVAGRDAILDALNGMWPIHANGIR